MSEQLRYDLIFCDDVRQEVNGKHLLVGVYGPEMIFKEFPAHTMLAIFHRIHNLPDGEHKYKLRMAGLGGEKDFEITAELSPEESVTARHMAHVVLNKIGIQIPNPTVLKFYSQLDDDPEIEIGQLVVRRLMDGDPTSHFL